MNIITKSNNTRITHQMKTKSMSSILVTMLFSLTAFSQNSGTLKVFSEEPVKVFVNLVQQPSYDVITLPEGTHYVKIFNKNEERIYNEIVAIVKGQITSILIEGDKTGMSPIPQAAPTADNVPLKVKSGQKTGTLNIFSELSGCSIYLNDNKVGVDLITIPNVPVGDHYLKVMKDGVSIFGDLISIKEGQVTSVLIRNDCQVAEIDTGKSNSGRREILTLIESQDIT